MMRDTYWITQRMILALYLSDPTSGALAAERAWISEQLHDLTWHPDPAAMPHLWTKIEAWHAAIMTRREHRST